MNNPIGEAMFVSEKGILKAKDKANPTHLSHPFCPHSSKILLLMDGLLENSKSVFIKRHIQVCEFCRERHDLIKNSFSAISKNIPAGEIDEIILEDISRELRELLKVVYQQADATIKKGRPLVNAVTFLKGIFGRNS